MTKHKHRSCHANAGADEYLFLGGDEVGLDCWTGSPTVSAWMKARGMNATELQSFFWREIAVRVLPLLNRTVGVWDNGQVTTLTYTICIALELCQFIFQRDPVLSAD
jgi:hypothetical protein